MKRIWSTIREAAAAWSDDKASRLAAAIAFYTLLSLAPLVVVATAIAGAVFGHSAATGALTSQLTELMGQAGAQVVTATINNANQPKQGIIASIIGIVMLLYGASGVFNELQDALNTVWCIQAKTGRGIWGLVRERSLTFAMVLIVGFLLLVTLVISTILAALGGHLGELIPFMPILMHAANFVLSFLFVTVLFALLFKVLPDAYIVWRDVWFGALITSGLFTVGKYLIGLYLGQGSVATPFGAAGSLAAFIVWIYYSAMILLFGAELTKVTAKHAGRQIGPASNAEAANCPTN